MGELTKALCGAEAGWGDAPAKGPDAGYVDRVSAIHAQQDAEYAAVETLQLAIMDGFISLSAMKVENKGKEVLLTGVNTPDGKPCPWQVAGCAGMKRHQDGAVREKGIWKALAELAGVDAGSIKDVEWRNGEKRHHPNRVKLILKAS